MKKVLFRLGLVLLFFSCAVLAFGSQVADVAKKERERRQKVGTPAKVFTNKDIADFKARNKDSDTSGGEGASKEGEEGTDVSGEGQSTADDASAIPPDPNAQSEKYWRDKYSEAKNHVTELQDQADNLQKTINGLLLNVSTYEATAAGPQLNEKLGEMKAQLDQVNKDLATAKQALEDLPDDARKAGADPGWVRE